MKRFSAVIVALALMIPLATVGCAKPTATTPPAALAPGYLNQADQVMGQALAAAHAFYVKIQTDSAAGKVTLSAQEKTALNDLGSAINVAQTAYLAYHAGTGSQAAAQAAVNNVTAKQNTVQTLMPGVQ